jgi:hypothetical protein
MEGERPMRYTLGQLLGRPHGELPFAFRYFQALETAITLPEAFQPFDVEVSVRSGSLRSPLRQSFAWKVTNGAAAAQAPAEPPRGSVR